MPDLAELASRFRAHAVESRPRAPLYARLSDAIADDPVVAGLLLHAPPSQRNPVLLFASVHSLLLDRPDHELARHYPNLTDPPAPGDPFPAFRSFCHEHEAALVELLATRSTQTNEIGRCALFLPALALLAAETGPLALVDIGTSGGLNLLLDRYRYRYEPGGEVGGEVGPGIDSGDRAVPVLACGTRGDVPVPAAMPPIAARVGLDRHPIDLNDHDAARWLEACVWPDQADRFHRLRVAIRMAAGSPPLVVTGDAVDDLPAAIEALGDVGHLTVMSSWVMSYLSRSEQHAFVTALDEVGTRRDLSWVIVESPSVTSGLPWPAIATDPTLTHLTTARWRDGARTATTLATCHPHGFWMHWQLRRR